MNITLRPEHEQFIQNQIARGRYLNPDELINEALQLLERQEQRLEELRHAVAIGTEQIQKGQVTDGEIVFAQLQEKLDQLLHS
jgi:antitoxin ParD1/3/4